jgi:hypothetical protein
MNSYYGADVCCCKRIFICRVSIRLYCNVLIKFNTNACLPVSGATAQGEPLPPLQPVSTVRFLNKIIFYRMRLRAPCPTPILEDQGISLRLDSTL